MDNALRKELTDRTYLAKKDYISFSLATFANGAIVGMTQGYLLIFYMEILGISEQATGVMFLIAKVFDGINDPIMGTIVDRTRTKWGKLRPYLIFCSIPFGIVFIALFMPVTGLPYMGRVIYMYVTYLLFGIIATLVGVPLMGLAAVVSPNNMERTKILSSGQICASVGEQSGLVLYTVFILFSTLKTSLTISAIIIGILGPTFIILSAFNLKERVVPSNERPNLLDAFKYLVKNKPFFAMTLANLLSFFRNLVSATVFFVVTYIFYKPELQIFFALPGAVAAMLGMVITPALKKKMDSKQIFIFATVMHSVGLGMVYLIGPGFGWGVTAAVMFFAMLPVGILNVMPNLMAADTIDYWDYKTGERKEGVTFAFMGFRSKISSGFKDFTLTFLLLWAGRQAITDLGLIPGQDELYIQTPQFEARLFMIYTIIPALTNLISIIPMFFYKLTGERLQKVKMELALRREEENQDNGEDSMYNGVGQS